MTDVPRSKDPRKLMLYNEYIRNMYLELFYGCRHCKSYVHLTRNTLRRDDVALARRTRRQSNKQTTWCTLNDATIPVRFTRFDDVTGRREQFKAVRLQSVDNVTDTEVLQRNNPFWHLVLQHYNCISTFLSVFERKRKTHHSNSYVIFHVVAVTA